MRTQFLVSLGRDTSNRPRLLLIGILALVPAAPCRADATANISSGNWFVKNSSSGSDSVWFGTFSWATTSNIIWTSGANNLNGIVFPAVSSSESKFAAGPTDKPAFVGQANNYPNATAAKRLTTTGTGSSSAGSAFYSASWSVTAAQTGLTKKVDTWRADMIGRDPWDILPSDLAGRVTVGTYSIYMPLGLLGGSDGGASAGFQSGFRYDLTYDTATSTNNLLDISVVGNQATVTPSSLYGTNLKIYAEAGPDVGPGGSSSTAGTLIDPASLQSLINSDIDSNDSLIKPLYLGIVLDGISVPTQTFGTDNAVAAIGYSDEAFESNTPQPNIPEPNTIGGVGLGLLCLAGLMRRISHQ